ncbi:substrate-binding domain-containing protein, partial [Candidatus Bathyarchaeota archaeon]|nr:substrate-binding domain-containing protein [Candidatus Bathyarchaeota archaeon]
MKSSVVTWIAAIAIITIVGISVYWSIPKMSEQTRTEKQLVNQKGSDTLLVLAQRWAEAYMAKNPNVQITVGGGGSGTGIAALINKQIDMADASREIKDKEIKDAKARGVEPVEWK